MPHPQMPNIPGVGAVTDTLDFVKNLWGSMGVPGMSLPGLGAPTLSVDDLEKKIADLKAVESWLNVNVSMLRGTIQALEIQRGTLATLKSMGASLADAMKQPGANEKSVLAASPFASFFGQPAATASQASKPPAPAAPIPQATVQAPPAVGTPFVPDATLWWNVLQDQFKQAVAGAMSPDAMANAGAKVQDAAMKMTGAAMSKPAADDKSAGTTANASDAADAATKPRATKPKPPARG